MNKQSVTFVLLSLVYICISCSSGGEQAQQKSEATLPIPEVGEVAEFDKPLTFQIDKGTNQSQAIEYSNSQSPDGTKFVILHEVDPTASSVLIHLGSISITPSEIYTGQGAQWSWSPDSRFIAVIGEDTYAGGGLSEIIIIDSESRRFTEIEPSYFSKNINIGLREMYKIESLSWSDNNTVSLTISVDYLGNSGHPGIDENRQRSLGDKFGTSDPIVMGNFEIKISEEPQSTYVTTKITRQSEIPFVVDPNNSDNERVSQINAAIRSEFQLTKAYRFEDYGWNQITFNAEIEDPYVSIIYDATYVAAYPTSYENQLILFSLETGEMITSQPIPFQNFFTPELYQNLLAGYWLDDVRPKFAEATNCAGTKPHCDMDEIQDYTMTSEGLKISLASYCYPHAAEVCTPIHSTIIDTTVLAEYLTDFGKQALLADGYSTMSAIERLKYERTNADYIQANLQMSEVWDTLTIIGTGEIYRTEESIQATNIFGIDRPLEIGDNIQVLPLRPELPILELAITNILLRDDIDYMPVWYEIALEEITMEEFRNVESEPNRSTEYPSELLIVYPPIDGCERLFEHQYSVADLPEDVTLDQVLGALDFDGDRLPDAVVTKYCCKMEADGSCDYTCGETYIKSGGHWFQIDSLEPL